MLRSIKEGDLIRYIGEDVLAIDKVKLYEVKSINREGVFIQNDALADTWLPWKDVNVMARAKQNNAYPSQHAVTTRDKDEINNPPHYNQGAVECIDAIQSALTEDEFRGYLKGNIIKYAWRERQKGGASSVKKLIWYANKLVAFLSGD